MRTRVTIKLIISCIVIFMISCKKLPEGVLGEKEMVDLLVDIHKGESVIDFQRGIYYNDSLKKTLKQSILLKHGVTQSQLDTSFVWYGNHIEDYIKIYDEVITRLENELTEVKGNNMSTPVFAEGDSINVWPLSSTYKFTDRDLITNLLFELQPDNTWQNGDNYQMQFKVVNSRQSNPEVRAFVYAKYDNGRVEFRPSSTSYNNWIKVRLVTDSTKMPVKIYGAISYQPQNGENIYIDSISLVRTRNRRDTYYERNGQRSFNSKNC